MNETMHATLTTLRAYVVALKKTHQGQVEIHNREEASKTAARLSYLVPLYKAMHAVVQQAGTPAEGGVKAYTLQFEKLRALLRKVMPYHSDFDKLFDGDVSKLQVLVPVAGISVEGWDAVSISMLTAQVMQEVENEQLAKLALARTAETARKAFIRSLNAEQRAALTRALEAAKANRSQAIHLYSRDLDAP